MAVCRSSFRVDIHRKIFGLIIEDVHEKTFQLVYYMWTSIDDESKRPFKFSKEEIKTTYFFNTSKYC